MQIPESKELHWQRIVYACHHITDALDCPIDPGILDAVIALNALGIPTNGSCEGHLDHGTGAPYIDIEAPIALADRRAAMHALAQASQQEQDAQTLEEQEASDQRYHEITLMQQRIYAPNLVLRAQLSGYLAQFYEHRHRAFDQRLVIQGLVIQDIGSAFRLEPQGAGLQSLADRAQKAVNLQAYQAEMTAFAAYLRALYFRDR